MAPAAMSVPRNPRQPLVGVALAAALGILLADYLSAPLYLLCGAVALLALASLARSSTALLQLLIVAGFFVLHLAQQVDAPGRKLAEQIGERPRPVEVTGVVVSEPKSTNDFVNFLLRLETITFGGRQQKSHATLRVRWKTAPELGDEIRLRGLAEPIPPARNPGVFDLRSYLARRDVHRSIFSRYAEDGEILRRGHSHLLLRLAAKSRDWMQATLTRGLEDSPEVCALISGMALGVRHETPGDIEEPFQQTGTLHLFAVAGLHVGIIAQLLWLLLGLCRVPRVVAAALIIPFLFFYSAITGLHVSSLRAATMAAVLLGGIFFGRRVFALNSLAAAAVVILAFDPNQLFTSGFQLSFSVVAAIILLQQRILRPLLRLSETDPFLPRSLVSRSRHFFERTYYWLAGGLSVSAAAWIGSILLIIWYFYLLTPISLLANLTVVPVAFIVLATGMLSLLAAPVSATLSVVFNNANWSLSQLILSLVQLFAQLPTGHTYVERPHWPLAAPTEITVLDAGAGAAVHLRAAGKDWLFDTASARDYEGFLRDYLHSRGIDQLDGLLLTHGDALHLGGAAAVLDEFRPRQFLDNPAPDRSRTHRALFAKSRQLLVRGDSFLLSPRVSARVLFPPAQFRAKAADDEALVIRLEIDGKFHVLLVSDSGLSTEKQLLATPNELASDVLVMGRHYSGVAVSEEFIDAVQPRLIIATSVAFPARERVPDDWAQTIRARGITLFRQDETGAVRLDFFGDHWTATPFLGHESLRSPSR